MDLIKFPTFSDTGRGVCALGRKQRCFMRVDMIRDKWTEVHPTVANLWGRQGRPWLWPSLSILLSILPLLCPLFLAEFPCCPSITRNSHPDTAQGPSYPEWAMSRTFHAIFTHCLQTLPFPHCTVIFRWELINLMKHMTTLALCHWGKSFQQTPSGANMAVQRRGFTVEGVSRACGTLEIQQHHWLTLLSTYRTGLQSY